MKWLAGIADSMDVSLRELLELLMDTWIVSTLGLLQKERWTPEHICILNPQTVCWLVSNNAQKDEFISGPQRKLPLHE